jgi:hypothetical protein
MRILQRVAASMLVMLLVVSHIVAQDVVYELPAVENASLIEASFEGETTAQLYGFYASEGDTVTITMAPSSNSDLDPYLLLFDGTTGELIAQNDDVASGNLIASLDSVEMPNDSAYIVLATSLIYLDGTTIETSDEQAYTLSIVGATIPDDTVDETIIELDIQAIDVNTTVSGDSDENSPVVFFAFDATANEAIAVTIDSEDFFTVLHFFAPDGTRVTTDASVIDVITEDDAVYLIVAGDLFFFEAGEDGFFTGGAFNITVEGN